jgi:hypothetical protein
MHVQTYLTFVMAHFLLIDSSDLYKLSEVFSSTYKHQQWQYITYLFMYQLFICARQNNSFYLPLSNAVKTAKSISCAPSPILNIVIWKYITDPFYTYTKLFNKIHWLQIDITIRSHKSLNFFFIFKYDNVVTGDMGKETKL